MKTVKWSDIKLHSNQLMYQYVDIISRLSLPPRSIVPVAFHGKPVAFPFMNPATDMVSD